jgi:fucose permease
VKTAVSVALYVVLLGFPDGGLGVVWPTIAADLHRPLGDLGLVVAAGTIPYLLASGATGRVLARVQIDRVLVVAAFVGAIALAGWAWSPAWAGVIAASALFGFARGAVDGGVNADFALNAPPSALGLAHGAYGVGATLAPVLATALLLRGPGWRSFYALLAVLAIAIAGFARVALRGEPADVAAHNGHDGHDRNDGPDAAAGISGVPRRVTTVATLAVFATYVAAEGATGAWAFTLLVRARHMPISTAGPWVATYWAGLTVGRFVLAALSHRVRPESLLHASVALGVVAVGWLWIDPWHLGVGALPFAGLGFAAIFPVLIALTPARVGRVAAPSVVGWSIAAAALGGPAATAAIGALVDRRGSEVIGVALFAATIVFAAAHVALDRVTA